MLNHLIHVPLLDNLKVCIVVLIDGPVNVLLGSFTTLRLRKQLLMVSIHLFLIEISQTPYGSTHRPRVFLTWRVHGRCELVGFLGYHFIKRVCIVSEIQTLVVHHHSQWFLARRLTRKPRSPLILILLFPTVKFAVDALAAVADTFWPLAELDIFV